ncbi:hypothetical protein Bbelb_203980 [Branchiostoma belcheri]|nr:hypothetical protein Bbelb_203980 [Branchiostoma belcheri]
MAEHSAQNQEVPGSNPAKSPTLCPWEGTLHDFPHFTQTNPGHALSHKRLPTQSRKAANPKPPIPPVLTNTPNWSKKSIQGFGYRGEGKVQTDYRSKTKDQVHDQISRRSLPSEHNTEDERERTEKTWGGLVSAEVKSIWKTEKEEDSFQSPSPSNKTQKLGMTGELNLTVNPVNVTRVTSELPGPNKQFTRRQKVRRDGEDLEFWRTRLGFSTWQEQQEKNGGEISGLNPLEL